MAMGEEYLTLKWGTIKGWDNFSEASVKLVGRFFEDGMCMSAMADKPDEKRKAILCELIDQLDGEIQNDWTGERMTKDDAKKYVMEYGQPKAEPFPGKSHFGG